MMAANRVRLLVLIRLLVISRMKIDLEARAEREREAHALAGAGQLDSGQRSVRRVQREADAVGFLQVPQIEVLEARGDLAGVGDQRHVDERTGGPAVLAAEEQPVAIAEAPRWIPAQRVAAAEIRH